MYNFVDPSPLVLVLGAALNHTKALQDVNDVVDTAALYAQLLRTLVQIEQTALRCSVEKQESAAKLAKALLFAIVCRTFNAIVTVAVDLRSRFKASDMIRGERNLRG